jgi:hypothetical protein
VAWVIKRCNVCQLTRGQTNAQKQPVIPILAKSPLDQLVIDLMDFRADPDGDLCWIGHLKSPFSKMCWLKGFPNKESQTIADWLEEWFDEHGEPRKL